MRPPSQEEEQEEEPVATSSSPPPPPPSFTCGICYSEDVVEAGCLDSCEHA